MQVRRTFSASRAWRPTVGAGLTRTLGCTNEAVRSSSRKCGLRRELEQPRENIAASSSQRRSEVHSQLNDTSVPFTNRESSWLGIVRFMSALGPSGVISSPAVAGSGGGFSQGQPGRRKVRASALLNKSRIGARSTGNLRSSKHRRRKPVQPNPSFKLSPNGLSHWPSCAGPAAHCAHAVQRAKPSVPA